MLCKVYLLGFLLTYTTLAYEFVNLLVTPGTMAQYESILARHNQSIEVLALGKWLIKGDKQQVLQAIQNSTIEHKLHRSRAKRSRIYGQSKLSLIRSENITAMYYNLEQIYEWIYFVKEQYSDIVELLEIGKSIQNRSLLVLKIGYKSDEVKKLFWFDAGIHAREWTTITAAMYSIDQILTEQTNKYSLMHKFLMLYDIYFMVMVNPDGYHYSLTSDILWRKNMRNFSEHSTNECFGVDLNRNFDYHWMKTGSSDDMCTEIYAGEQPASEPETSAIQQFILSRAPDWLSFISIHSYGALWLHHWEKKDPIMTKANYIKICSKARYALHSIEKQFNYSYSFGMPSQLLSYDATGSGDAWAMMVADIPYAYTLEIGPTNQETFESDFYFGFQVHERRIEYIVQRAYTGLREYMKTFLFRLNPGVQDKIMNTCLNDFDMMKRNFSGYWS